MVSSMQKLTNCKHECVSLKINTNKVIMAMYIYWQYIRVRRECANKVAVGPVNIPTYISSKVFSRTVIFVVTSQNAHLVTSLSPSMHVYCIIPSSVFTYT